MEIAVISGKGGTGKSSISAAFATIGPEMVVADCDVDAANLYLIFNPSHETEEAYVSGSKAAIDETKCSLCGICADYCRFDAIEVGTEKVTIKETACDGCFLCSRICPSGAITMVPEDKSRMYSGSFRNGKMVYGRLAPGEENSGRLVTKVRQKAKQLAKESGFEKVLLDGPPGIGCPVISTIAGVDRIIVVTEPTLSGLYDMQRTIELAKQPGRKISAIINKFDLNPEISTQISEWCKSNGVELAGFLPFDARMVEAMVQTQSITEYAPESEIGRKLAQIWDEIIKQG